MKTLILLTLLSVPVLAAPKRPLTREAAVAQAIERFNRDDARRALVARHKAERLALRDKQRAERESLKLPGRLVSK